MNFSKKLSVVAAAIPFLMVVGCDSSSSGESTVAPTPNEVEEPSVKDSSNVELAEKDTVEKDSVATDSVDTKPVAERGSSSSVQSANGSSSSVQSSTPSTTEETGHCFESWLGGNGIARISTGYDAGFNNSGYWYTYNDNEDGGKSSIKWAAEPDEYGGLETVLEKCGTGLCGTYKLDKGTLDYDPYVAVAFDLAGKDADGRTIPVDASGMGGIAITLSMTHAAILELSMGDEEDAKVDYALPAYDLGKASTGKSVYIPWSKFTQPSWGKVKISTEEAVKKLASVRIKIQAKSGSNGEFNIMKIEAYGRGSHSFCSDYVPPVSSSSIVPKSSSSETVIPKSSSSYTGIVVEASAIKCDGFSWSGIDDETRIDTECDAGGNTSGIWFSYTDSTDRGESVLNWAVRNQFSDHDPEFEDCYGVCGKYTLNKGRLDYDPYVGVGFNLGGTDKDGNLVPVDATSMKQVCIVFSSTHAATLEMGLTDELEERVGYGVPAADLGKSTTGKSVCIPWSKFAQPAWVKSSQTISAEEAVKSLVSFRFKIQAKDGSEGKFNIMRVDPYGLAAGGAN